MAKAADELVNLVTGLKTVFRKTAQDTGGELLRVDWIGEPGWTLRSRLVPAHGAWTACSGALDTSPWLGPRTCWRPSR
jgi:hypothetical protein